MIDPEDHYDNFEEQGAPTEVIPTCWYCQKDRKPGADCPCGAPAEMPEHWMEDYR